LKQPDKDLNDWTDAQLLRSYYEAQIEAEDLSEDPLPEERLTALLRVRTIRNEIDRRSRPKKPPTRW